jgi:hypothetical protein
MSISPQEKKRRYNASASKKASSSRYEATENAKARRRQWEKTPAGRRLKARHQRRRSLKRLGWSVESYGAALARQSGKCFLCGSPPKEGRRLHADHHHGTGQPRALLRNLCNRYVGCIEKYPGLWARFQAYVQPACGEAGVDSTYPFEAQRPAEKDAETPARGIRLAETAEFA